MAQLHDIPKYGFGTAFEIDPESGGGRGAGGESSATCSLYISREQDPRLTPNQVKNLIMAAIQLGCRHFDCAPLYGTQRLVGAALKEAMGTVPRQHFFLTSKLPPNMMRQENIVRSVVRSINELQCSYLDLLLIHAPFSTRYISDDFIYPTDDEGNLLLDEQEHLLENAWRKLAELKRDGYTRYIGISNVNIEQLERLNNIYQVDVVQNEYHIYNQDREIFDYCEELDIHFEAYAAFGSPIKARRDGKPCFNTDPVVRRVARSNQITIAQTNIQWIHQQPLSYVVRCDTIEQLEENIMAIDHIYLPLNDLIDLDSLNRNVRIYYFDEHKGLDRHREYPFTRPTATTAPPTITTTIASITTASGRGLRPGPLLSPTTPTGAGASFEYGQYNAIESISSDTSYKMYNSEDTDEEPLTYRPSMSTSASTTSTISSATAGTISSSSSASASDFGTLKSTGTWPRAAIDHHRNSDHNHNNYHYGDDTDSEDTIGSHRTVSVRVGPREFSSTNNRGNSNNNNNNNANSNSGSSRNNNNNNNSNSGSNSRDNNSAGQQQRHFTDYGRNVTNQKPPFEIPTTSDSLTRSSTPTPTSATSLASARAQQRTPTTLAGDIEMTGFSTQE